MHSLGLIAISACSPPSRWSRGGARAISEATFFARVFGTSSDFGLSCGHLCNSPWHAWGAWGTFLYTSVHCTWCIHPCRGYFCWNFDMFRYAGFYLLNAGLGSDVLTKSSCATHCTLGIISVSGVVLSEKLFEKWSCSMMMKFCCEILFVLNAAWTSCTWCVGGYQMIVSNQSWSSLLSTYHVLRYAFGTSAFRGSPVHSCCCVQPMQL